jgi:hypothetical protein
MCSLYTELTYFPVILSIITNSVQIPISFRQTTVFISFNKIYDSQL